jgi:hypothetical protein
MQGKYAENGNEGVGENVWSRRSAMSGTGQSHHFSACPPRPPSDQMLLMRRSCDSGTSHGWLFNDQAAVRDSARQLFVRMNAPGDGAPGYAHAERHDIRAKESLDNAVCPGRKEAHRRQHPCPRLAAGHERRVCAVMIYKRTSTKYDQYGNIILLFT